MATDEWAASVRSVRSSKTTGALQRSGQRRSSTAPLPCLRAGVGPFRAVLYTCYFAVRGNIVDVEPHREQSAGLNTVWIV